MPKKILNNDQKFVQTLVVMTALSFTPFGIKFYPIKRRN
ncbi:hypothetical protein Lp16_H023 (plasmid) [Lactiplantibacillus plantarum 16]|nr:hypothetical protein Lp16_H023 [Lactiplantibacillus plantarum 16]